MSVTNQSKINYLLQKVDPNGLFFSEWMKKEGYSGQLVKRYRDSGWLDMLSRGVMYRKGTLPTAYAALASYNQQLKRTFRVAAHSALELAGFNHYVPMGKPLLVVASDNAVMPNWMKSDLFDKTFEVFSTDTFSEPEVSQTRVGTVELLVSAPEQAFFECLLLAPKQYSYMDLFYIMEQLTSLRPDKIESLLRTTKSIRIRRMFLYMAEKAGHYWFHMLDVHNIDLGMSKMQLAPGGIYIPKYRITVPKELNEYG